VTAIEQVPCAGTGRASYGTNDSAGAEIASLDPIDDPAGGYLGVYDSPIAAPGDAKRSIFRVILARSADLIHWTRVRILDPVGASQPTLRAIPGGDGYLLAYEKHLPGRVAHSLRIRYYATRSALLRNHTTAQVDLPIHFSRFSNGTPSLQSIVWHGGLARSTIGLTFHYETATSNGKPGPDREASGTLRGFHDWQVSRDGPVDASLDGQGLIGSHGDRRQFSFAGRLWRVYEAQTRFGDFGTWHVLLDDIAEHSFRKLRFTTGARLPASSSFGNPTAAVLRAPDGHGRVLVVTMFVFSAGQAAATPGELVYYQPL
jgi:hypothetical protein